VPLLAAPPESAPKLLPSVRRFVRFHGLRHPAEMGEREIAEFLTHLAIGARVAASTQTQALSALLFLYRDILGRPFEELQGIVRAKRPERVPVVLSRVEIRTVLGCLTGVPRIVAALLYGAGLRLLEELRVKDRLRAAPDHRPEWQGGEGPGDRAATGAGGATPGSSSAGGAAASAGLGAGRRTGAVARCARA